MSLLEGVLVTEKDHKELNCGYFVQEEKIEESIALITNFMKK